MPDARARFAHNSLCAQSIADVGGISEDVPRALNGIGGAWLYTTLHIEPRWDLIMEEVRLMKRGFEVGLLSGSNTYVDGAADGSRYQFQGSRLPV